MLPTPFKFEDVMELRRAENLPDEGSRQMVNNWTHRGYIEYDDVEKTYIKTSDYLNRTKAA